MNTVLKIRIQNSSLMDQVRLHCHLSTFNDYYFDRVLSTVITEASQKNGFNKDLIVHFEDNHWCNALVLDTNRLKNVLLTLFKTVTFYTENMYDVILNPDEFLFKLEINTGQKLLQQYLAQSLDIINTQPSIAGTPKKMFGLQIHRPDTHRIALLVELYRRGLMEHIDVSNNLNLDMLAVDEYRRQSNIDLVCWYFDIGFKELINILSDIPRGDLDHFYYKKNNAQEMITLNVQQNLKADNFLIDIVCDSKINDYTSPISEKLARPVVCKKPFIFLGPKDSYSFLKISNTKSFGHLWDESWDKYSAEFLKDKIIEIANTCEYILKTYNILDLRTLCQDSVDHNFENAKQVANNGMHNSFKEKLQVYCQTEQEKLSNQINQ